MVKGLLLILNEIKKKTLLSVINNLKMLITFIK